VKHLTIHFPGKLVIGNGTVQKLPGELIQNGYKKVLIVTIEPLFHSLESFIAELKHNGIQLKIETSITQEPSFSDFHQLMTNLKEFNPDVVVGIGGGSVLDVAKLVAAQLDNDQGLTEIVGIGLLKGRNKALICIPTTSGTGSEVSPNAILVDERDSQKKGIISPYLVPDIVYLDPLLSLSVPGAITAATGLDALTHCLEAYTNKFAHPFIDMYAFEGMRLIAGSLLQAVKNGVDEEARSKVALGSLLGGFCLGPVNTAGVHALSYPLGSTFHLAHGLSNALLLPFVMEYNLPAATGRYADVAVALGCERGSNETTTAQRGIERVRSLIAECGIPARLREVGILQEAIPQMAKDALKIQRLLKNNPREITEQDAIDIYTAAY
jgi:alcohol dehydrogenase